MRHFDARENRCGIFDARIFIRFLQYEKKRKCRENVIPSTGRNSFLFFILFFEKHFLSIYKLYLRMPGMGWKSNYGIKSFFIFWKTFSVYLQVVSANARHGMDHSLRMSSMSGMGGLDVGHGMDHSLRMSSMGGMGGFRDFFIFEIIFCFWKNISSLFTSRG